MDELLYISTVQFFYFRFLKIVNIMNLFLCTMCITIELWSSIEKLNEGITPFCVFLVFGFGYSFIIKPQNRSIFSTWRSLLRSYVCLVGGCKHVASWPKICLKYILKTIQIKNKTKSDLRWKQNKENIKCVAVDVQMKLRII